MTLPFQSFLSSLSWPALKCLKSCRLLNLEAAFCCIRQWLIWPIRAQFMSLQPQLWQYFGMFVAWRDHWMRWHPLLGSDSLCPGFLSSMLGTLVVCWLPPAELTTEDENPLWGLEMERSSSKHEKSSKCLWTYLVSNDISCRLFIKLCFVFRLMSQELSWETPGQTLEENKTQEEKTLLLDHHTLLPVLVQGACHPLCFMVMALYSLLKLHGTGCDENIMKWGKPD